MPDPQLAEDGGLPEALHQLAAQLGGDDDHREGEEDARGGVGVAGGGEQAGAIVIR